MNDRGDTPGQDDAGRCRRFEVMYAEHHAGVLDDVLRRTDSPDDAADVRAETFLVAWRWLNDAPMERCRVCCFGVARRVLASDPARRTRARSGSLGPQCHSRRHVRTAAPRAENQACPDAAPAALEDGTRSALPRSPLHAGACDPERPGRHGCRLEHGGIERPPASARRVAAPRGRCARCTRSGSLIGQSSRVTSRDRGACA